MSRLVDRTRTAVRTSRSHPLQIAGVAAGPGLGRIGVTFCPGKRQATALTGAWDRDLALDLDAVAAWGAVAVVTLVEAHELVALGVTGLGAAVADRHMDWLHLPIPDVGVPDAAFEAAWQQAGEGLHARLRAGFDVLVHCKGGLGRAGLVAARLLVELGHAPDEALALVRAVRPGAVETRAQERFVQALRPVPEWQPNTAPADVLDRGRGALLGLAVGDAVGTTLEFSRRDSRPRVTNLVGGGPFGLKPGEWTDDTAMALALAESLAYDRVLDAHDLMDRFRSWQHQGVYSCTGRCFDIGVTTSQALGRFARTGDPLAGVTDPRSAGNGSLMRLAPVALAHWHDPAELARVAALQSRTTHGAAEAVDACVLFAAILADAIAGRPGSEVLRPRRMPTASPAVQAIAGAGWRGKQRSDIASSGYVVHSLEAALWCVGRTADFRSAVLLAANLGDDADTTAAITGQLAGALHGVAGIPADWLAKLAWRERLDAAARALLA